LDKVCQLDVIWVPGGDPAALAPMMNGKQPTYVDFLKKQSTKAHYISSVCEGALLLAAAGLLDGFKATTHWRFDVQLRIQYYPDPPGSSSIPPADDCFFSW
jgi:cyclohexyl-isocyanide hydratase